MSDSRVPSSCPPAMFVVVIFVTLFSIGGASGTPNDGKVDGKFHAWSMLDGDAPVVVKPRPIRRYVDEEMEREMEMRIPEGSGEGDDEDAVYLRQTSEVKCTVPDEMKAQARVCNFTGAQDRSRLPKKLYRLFSLTELDIHAAEQLRFDRELCLEQLRLFDCKQVAEVDMRVCGNLLRVLSVSRSSVGSIFGRYKELNIKNSQIDNLDISVISRKQNNITSTKINVLWNTNDSSATLNNASYGGINVEKGSLKLWDVDVDVLGRGGFNVTNRGQLFFNNVRFSHISPDGIIMSGHGAVVGMRNLRVSGFNVLNAIFEIRSSEPLLIYPLQLFRSKKPTFSKTLSIMLCLLGFLIGILLGSVVTYFCCAMRFKSRKMQINVPDGEEAEGTTGQESGSISTPRPVSTLPPPVQGVSYLASNQSAQVLGSHRPEEPLRVQQRSSSQDTDEDPVYHYADNVVLNQIPDNEPFYQDTDTEPFYQDTDTEPLYQDTGDEPIYGNIQTLETTKYGATYKGTRNEDFHKGKIDGASYKDSRDDEPLYDALADEPTSGNIGGEPGGTIDQEEPIYGNIGGSCKDPKNGAFYKDSKDDEPLYDTTADEPLYGEPDQHLGSPPEGITDQEEPIYGNIGGCSSEGWQSPHQQASTSQYEKNEDDEIYANLTGDDDEIYANL